MRRTVRHNTASLPRKAPDSGVRGSMHVSLLSVLATCFVMGGWYLYSVNQSAVQGYHIRALEKEIGRLKEENAELKITEADLRSLYRLESSGEAQGMHKLDEVIYLEERGPIALR